MANIFAKLGAITLLSAQMNSGFFRFMGMLSSGDNVSYVTPSPVSILVVRNCHDVDLPNYAGNVYPLALIVWAHLVSSNRVLCIRYS